MSFAYRCSKCRGRNTLAHELNWYKRTPKCRHCGHNGFYLDKARQYRTDICRDEECCHYPHRYQSTLCRHHPEHELLVRVHRYGEDRAEVELDIAFNKLAAIIEEEAECPF